MIYIISILLLVITIILFKNKNIKFIKENSYQDYTKFYGQESLKDPKFIKKMKIIYQQITKYCENNINTIAELSGCTYTECILKIRYLKNLHKISEEYFIDEINGIVNLCSKEEQELLKKYRPYIYRNRLQIPEIAARLPEVTNKNRKEIEKKVLQDLIYLDEKDLLDGLLLNRVDGTITYYDFKKHKYMKDKITVNCQNCGAPAEVNRGGKTWCSYCGSIVEDYKNKKL